MTQPQDVETSGTGVPQDYAAARRALLGDPGLTGTARRAALSDLTDAWLSRLLATALGTGAPAVGAGAPAAGAPAAGPPGAPHGASAATAGPAPVDAPAPKGKRGLRVALVAVGGYGRGRLSPRSDLDVLLLHDGGDAREVAELAERVWYPVWDQGVDLDHSVRDLAQARAVAAEDLKAQLGLLDARHIAGDQALTAELRSALLADWRATAPRRLPELDEMCRQRAERHGELSFLLEPDLKEARGGLRDVVALSAIAASWIADPPRDGLAEAADRLSDVRDALHLATGRATDRLSLQDQDQVAAELGLLDADTLLRQVYEAARTIAYAADTTWREVHKVLRARSGRGRRSSRIGLPFVGGSRAAAAGAHSRGGPERRPLAEGVVEQDGEAVLAVAARPAQDPVLVLRVAAAAAQAGLPLAPGTVKRLAAECRPLPVPWPAEAREQLVTLLGAGAGAVPVWEALEAGGLITRLLPDWERVRFRPQRNAVHRWTVDRHLVETAVRAADFTRRVDRPDLLLVAALLHDIGKGWPGDHSVAGEVIVRDVAPRLGFPPADVDVLALLVRHHLLLVETATRRDPDDPATVGVVTSAVRSVGTLELLHALTEADALATGPAAWSNWRAALVGDLVERASAVLAGEAPPEAAEPAGPTAEEERLAFEAVRTRGPALALRASAPDARFGEPAAGEPDTEEGDGRGPEPLGAELILAVPDRPNLLPLVAGVLALHRLTVRAAHIARMDPAPEFGDPGPGSGAGPGSGSGEGAEPTAILVLTWQIAAEFGELPDSARLRADIRRALDGGLDVTKRLAERDAAVPRRRRSTSPPPRVTVAGAASASATVLEVRAHDAPGLLHRIGRALEEAGVRVRTARISTLGADAVDAFYITDADGAPLPPGRAGALAASVQRALA